MYLLAHAGITIAAAYTIEKAVNCRPACDRTAAGAGAGPAVRAPLHVDYRFILLGALLPDLIDKPLGLLLLPGVIDNGRTFLHTLLFLALTMLAAAAIYRQGRRMWGIYIAFGVLLHFIMDAMWTDPVTLYWPFLGAFRAYPGISAWILQSWIQSLREEQYLYIPETAGLLILVFFAARVIIQKRAKAFILKGRL
jgi:membrane-bound metal-dependent hydrolase YbcI (DUF457 family)